jgi:hypothetical protein
LNIGLEIGLEIVKSQVETIFVGNRTLTAFDRYWRRREVGGEVGSCCCVWPAGDERCLENGWRRFAKREECRREKRQRCCVLDDGEGYFFDFCERGQVSKYLLLHLYCGDRRRRGKYNSKEVRKRVPIVIG